LLHTTADVTVEWWLC